MGFFFTDELNKIMIKFFTFPILLISRIFLLLCLKNNFKDEKRKNCLQTLFFQTLKSLFQISQNCLKFYKYRTIKCRNLKKKKCT